MLESVWTRELTDNLARLWAEGHSTAEIGRRLGVSKNCIIGKAHRIGLQSRPSPLKPEPRRTHAPRPELRPGATTGACCWPVGNPGESDFGFCGQPTVVAKPYCAEHVARAYTKKPQPVA